TEIQHSRLWHELRALGLVAANIPGEPMSGQGQEEKFRRVLISVCFGAESGLYLAPTFTSGDSH
ncbi:MAG: hypothetical protein QF503_01185, partial [Rhodospirillales bacterium]|nr:hypothetical protein [Rhodospirillales bacterium]